jgi:monovalent cation:H+ antiporter-2, CPA2 family
MHNLDLILTLTGGLAAALLLGYFTQRMGLSPIVGYLLAGVAVGPRTPGFEANAELAEQLAEVGVILLMFGVGLHFHLKELLAVWRVAVPGAVGQSLVATALGALAGLMFGWTFGAGLVFGLAISVASTVVLLRVLADNNDLHTPAGHIAVGWLVVEDLFTVFVLVILPVLFQGAEGGTASVFAAIAWAILKISLLVAITFVAGRRLIPWLLDHMAATRSRELFTLTVLVIALGIAVGSAEIFHVSMALGAFLAGMVVGQSEFSSRAASEVLPLRDAFAVLFFVSVGMLFDPQLLLDHPGIVAVTFAIIVVGKPLAALAVVLFLGYPLRTGLSVAVALAQIGEFSFILAKLGEELAIFKGSERSTLVAASIVSIAINPLLYRFVDPFEAWLRKRELFQRWSAIFSGRAAAPKWIPAAFVRLTARRAESMGTGGSGDHDAEHADSFRAVVVGYGPVGQTVARLLRENEIVPAIVDLNLETVRRLRSEGLQAVYGDATSREALEEAGVGTAVALILSSSGMRGSEESIRLARELNPKIRVFARSSYLREVDELKKAGADVVFAGEGEVALTMTEFLLRQLGATAEQVDRERERIRQELFGKPVAPDSLLDAMKENAAMNGIAAASSDEGPRDVSEGEPRA